MTAPERELTTSPLQQLFVMNSPFMSERAADLAKRVSDAAEPRNRFAPCIATRWTATRCAKELDTSPDVSGQGKLVQFAQALLSSNEVIFWP